METLYAAADLTGTHVTAALGTAAGVLRYTGKAAIPTGSSPDAIVDVVVTLFDKLTAQAGRSPAALGLAVPERDGSTPAAFLEHRLRLPVRAASAMYCAAIAELRFGHGRDYPTFGIYRLDTHLAGMLVLDGHPWPGGEWGHQTVHPAGPLCSCGNTGCLELFAGGAAIARNAGYPDAFAAAAAARRAEPRAVAAFHEAAHYLGIAAANLFISYRPRALLFTGPLAEQVDLLLLPVRAALNERVRGGLAQEVAVRRAVTAANPVLLGALALHAPFPAPLPVLP